MRLSQILRRTHTRIAVTAVAVASVLLLIAGLLAQRTITQNNLDLMARSLLYNVEAALIFGDQGDAAQSLKRMVQNEDVAEAMVWDAQGQVFAQWVAPEALPCRCGTQLARVLGVKVAQQDVLSHGHVVGRIGVVSSGRGLLGFLLWALLALGLCVAASMVVAHIVSRRMHRHIVQPLQELGRVARAVHCDRAMGLRVRSADIDELQELGEHFNALLDELEARQQHLQQENMALEHQASHDALTGVFNRAYFELRLMSALRHAGQTQGRLAVLFMDLNRFKEVNDTYGHGMGDVLLIAVAQRIQAQVRDADLVARLGGDEFVVLLLEPRSEAAVQHVLHKIATAVSKPLPCDGGLVLQPSISIGMAMYPEHGQSMEALMEAADTAMYAVKQKANPGGLRFQSMSMRGDRGCGADS
ncbi:diguanylate cyclase domain-containing protein [Comamonas sp. GB3 AK4-5]|uniref:diguanylate cyclase domain-containing protein n=1 Tax=Comamonas sp. GB3 AK4-5 TaxID=3231487 RepID=UPI00351F3183